MLSAQNELLRHDEGKTYHASGNHVTRNQHQLGNEVTDRKMLCSFPGEVNFVLKAFTSLAH